MSAPSWERANGHQANRQNPSGALARIAKTALARSPDERAHLADGEEILQTDHLASFCCDGRRGGDCGFADASIRHDYVNGCDGSPVGFP